MFWTIVRFCLRLPVATTLAYGLQSMFPHAPLLCVVAGVAGLLMLGDLSVKPTPNP